MGLLLEHCRAAIGHVLCAPNKVAYAYKKKKRAARKTKFVNAETARPLRTHMRACTHAYAHARIQSCSAAYAHAGVSVRAAHWQAHDFTRITSTDDAYIHQRVHTYGRGHTDTPRVRLHGHVHAHAFKM